MLYVIIILFCGLFLSAILSLFLEKSFFTLLLFSSLAIVAVILVDAVTATLARLLPSKLAQHDKKLFIVSAKEKKFYERLKIRKWKDKVPEIGHFTGFRKNKIADPKSVEYLERFLLEACYGEIGHILSCFTGFLIVPLFPLTEVWIAVTLPVAFLNALLNLPSLFILRYNSYKLKILLKSNLKRSQRVNT